MSEIQGGKQLKEKARVEPRLLRSAAYTYTNKQPQHRSTVSGFTFMQHLVGKDFTPAGVFDLAVKRSEGVVAGRPGDFSGGAVASVRLGAQDMSLLVGILVAQTQRVDGRNGPVAAHTQQRRRVHRGRHRVRIDQSHV